MKNYLKLDSTLPASFDPNKTDMAYYIKRYNTKLEYYINRIDNLMLSGDKILDAGCGSGAWSIALSQRYKSVVARDLSQDGLDVFNAVKSLMGINNIQTDRGDLEKLPYDDNSFDDIFCYSVIMYCNVPDVLSEFFRVLKPSGRVYLCLNNDGYYHYLINERGKREKDQEEYGKKTLYNTYIKRFMQNQDIEIKANISQYCGRQWLATLDEDLKLHSKNEPISVSGYDTRAYSFAEMEDLAVHAGFTDFKAQTEGMLITNEQGIKLEPLYHGYYNDTVTVWECLFKKS
ncbi:MAG: class I SAM-dependent methyltransferase [Defluviitaleaceae bacterium]|nr:class I SAM-dependent methyltransferase [Defluviitaleaceae bacterium]